MAAKPDNAADHMSRSRCCEFQNQTVTSTQSMSAVPFWFTLVQLILLLWLLWAKGVSSYNYAS